MELIDGTELKKHIESTICNGCEIGHVVTPCGRCSITNVLRHIDRMEKIDAQPVKHGKWDDSYDGITPVCTVCGNTHRCIMRNPGYCPNCGAKMDGESDA